MATDYDAPRHAPEDGLTQPLEALTTEKNATQSVIDVDEAELADELNPARGRRVPRGTPGPGGPDPGGRIHLQVLFPGPPPQPAWPGRKSATCTAQNARVRTRSRNVNARRTIAGADPVGISCRRRRGRGAR